LFYFLSICDCAFAFWIISFDSCWFLYCVWLSLPFFLLLLAYFNFCISEAP
jgi:hypothetical protein